MASSQNTFMFLKAGPYGGTSDELHSEIDRYCWTIDKPFLKKKLQLKWHFLYTYKDMMCPLQVKSRRQSHNSIWNLTQVSINLAHTCVG